MKQEAAVKRLCAAGVGLWGAAVVGLTGCAPTAMGPMVMRMGPGAPDRNVMQVGMRSGPRLSAPIAGTQGGLGTGNSFRGNESSFSTQQWGVAFDAALTVPVSERLHLHTGLQGEFLLPIPLPGYGLYAGASYYVGSERLGLAPALSLRGASDFGLGTPRGGPGTIFGAEVSCALTMQPEKKVSIGLVPFASWHTVASHGRNEQALYYGGVVAARVSWGGKNDFELSGGFGRAKVGKSVSWNVPIMGARGGR
ncbi:hypothetical protein [Myxococcus xanthus]|uniref:Lipoprotein n=1 Tax=Myxococcus xanthus TaxID=34 RepID=A0A7Y4IFR2_MYXXA|nr:hypothetical protein [Myxococcus xanthus]NOJ78349.1 hypothetical protein [Myxococcus xanthus]NOJ85443.1 hypothetical protein [Myxococcus xanthus]